MKVHICTPLFSYTGNRALVDASGATLDELTHDLERQFPGIRFRIIDEQNQVRPHVKLFVNRQQIQSLASKLSPKDEIAIIQAFSGG